MKKYPPIMMMRKGNYYVRLPYNAGYDELLSDQRIQFGAPCIRGTRIPVTSIYGQFKGGDSLKYIAKSYRITEKQAQAAIDFVEGK